MRVQLDQQRDRVLDGTDFLAGDAQRRLAETIASCVGRGFFGKTTIALSWEAGQIVHVRDTVEQVESVCLPTEGASL